MVSYKQVERIKHIGTALRQLRLNHNPQKLTLQEVAEAVGYSTATLSQIERGVIAPSIQGLLKLADFYKVSQLVSLRRRKMVLLLLQPPIIERKSRETSMKYSK